MGVENPEMENWVGGGGGYWKIYTPKKLPKNTISNIIKKTSLLLVELKFFHTFVYSELRSKIEFFDSLNFNLDN